MPQDTLQDRASATIHLPAGADQLIRRAAARRHKSRSSFIRDAAIEAAERVLATPAPVPDAEPAAAVA